MIYFILFYFIESVSLTQNPYGYMSLFVYLSLDILNVKVQVDLATHNLVCEIYFKN